jgi:hypothetical protein
VRGLAEEEVSWGEKGVTVGRGSFYSGAARRGTGHGRRHATTRGGGGAWGQRGDRAARRGQHRSGCGACGRRTRERCATGSETREGGG